MGAVFNISLPTAWAELTEKQLLLVFALFASNRSTEEVKTLCLMKWNNLEVLNEQPKHYFLIRQRNRKRKHPPRGIRGGLFILTSRQIQTATARNHGDGDSDSFFAANFWMILKPTPVILANCRIPAPF